MCCRKSANLITTFSAILLALWCRIAFAQGQAQGVFVDPEGVLRTVVVGDRDRLNQAKQAAAVRPTGAVTSKTSLRMVSLAGIAREVRACKMAGTPIPHEIECLAGLQQIQFLFIYPDAHDIVIAGPAEGWDTDATGRVFGETTKRPVLLLDDLIVALRVFPPGGTADTIVGCTINQTEEGMRRLQQYMASVGNSLNADRNRIAPALAQGVRDSMGLHNVEIWGVPPNSHLGRVMVEADYRMKLIGIGVEDSRVRGLASYYSLIGAGETGRLKVQHWWFVPEYEAILRNDDGTAFEFRGQRAKLVGADDRPVLGGQTVKGKTAGGATQRFADSFTAHFEQLARVNPIYAELQNAFDLVIIAALIQQGDHVRRVAPDLGYFFDPRGYDAESLAVPRHVESVVNVKFIGNRIATPVGGVTVEPARVLRGQARSVASDSDLVARRAAARAFVSSQRWWTD